MEDFKKLWPLSSKLYEMQELEGFDEFMDDGEYEDVFAEVLSQEVQGQEIGRVDGEMDMS